MNISYEDFVEKLKSVGGKLVDAEYFQRSIELQYNESVLIFDWYKNYCSLKIGVISMPSFVNIIISKFDIMLINENDNVVCTIPLSK